MRAIDRWRALTPRQKAATLRGAVLLARAEAGITILGVPRMLRSTQRDVRGNPASALEVRDLIAAIDRASRYVPGATCLPRAIALTWMLRRRGVAAAVRLGARSRNGAFTAHAWVEFAGRVLNDPEIAQEYEPL